MSDIPDPTDPDLYTLVTTARGDPGLALQLLLLCAEVLRLTRVVLRNEPETTLSREAVEHFLLAQEHLRQCLRLRVLPDGPPPASVVTPEAQASIDAALAAHALPQP